VLPVFRLTCLRLAVDVVSLPSSDSASSGVGSADEDADDDDDDDGNENGVSLMTPTF